MSVAISIQQRMINVYNSIVINHSRHHPVLSKRQCNRYNDQLHNHTDILAERTFIITLGILLANIPLKESPSQFSRREYVQAWLVKTLPHLNSRVCQIATRPPAAAHPDKNPLESSLTFLHAWARKTRTLPSLSTTTSHLLRSLSTITSQLVGKFKFNINLHLYVHHQQKNPRQCALSLGGVIK